MNVREFPARAARAIRGAFSRSSQTETREGRTTRSLGSNEDSLLPGFYAADGFHAAKIAFSDGRAPTGGMATRHERNALGRKALVKLSRDLRKDSDLYTAYCRRMRRYVIGQGFVLQSQAKGDGSDGSDAAAKAWNQATETRFNAWAESSDLRGRSWGRMQRAVFDETFTCGDTGVLLVENAAQEGKLQHFESEQIDGPNGPNDDGIKRDAFGTPLSYSVCPYGESGQADVTRAVTHSPETFIFVCDPERPSSSRGMPYLQAGFSQLYRARDILNSETIARQMQAKIALAITRATGLPLPGVASNVQQSATASDDDDPATKYQTNLPTATVFHGKTGDKIEGMQRSAPGSDFALVLATILRLLCAVGGMPLEFFIFDFTKLNYSQFRGAVEVFQAECEDWQQLIESLFHRRVYRWWLDREIAAGRIQDRPDKYAHSWIKGKFPWTDKLKEAQAAGEQSDRGQATFASIAKSQNLDPEQLLAKLIEETMTAIKASKKIETKTGVNPGWQRFCGLKIPPSAPVGPDGKAPSQPDGDDDEKDASPDAPAEKEAA